MSEFEFPGKKEDNDEEVKRPEFIYIDDTGKSNKTSWEHFNEKYSESFGDMTKKSFPVAIRFIFFILALFLLFVALLATPIVIGFFFINVVTLFTLRNFWRKTIDTWEAFKKILVICMGLIIAIFSPQFGTGIIFLYLVMKGKSFNDHFISKIIKSRMR